VPHEGDPRLFFALDNLQTVAKAWHDSVKQARERRADKAAFRPKWLKPSAADLTIVCGPPLAGKSTYVEARARQGDVVIDLDVIASEISGEPLHRWSREKWLNAALFRRNDMLGDLSTAVGKKAWFIIGEPKAERRQWWQDRLHPREIVVLETPAETCLQRLAGEQSRDKDRATRAISSWWTDYTRRAGDACVQW